MSALSEVRIDQTSPHGAFHNSPRNGRAKKAMATPARIERRDGQALLPDPAMADGDRGVGRRLAHGAPKPYSARMAWPSAPMRKSMNASPTSWFWDAATVAIGYSATHVDVVGDLDHVGGVAGGDDVGDVDDAGVGLTGGHLGDHAAHVLLQAHRRHGRRRRR